MVCHFRRQGTSERSSFTGALPWEGRAGFLEGVDTEPNCTHDRLSSFLFQDAIFFFHSATIAVTDFAVKTSPEPIGLPNLRLPASRTVSWTTLSSSEVACARCIIIVTQDEPVYMFSNVHVFQGHGAYEQEWLLFYISICWTVYRLFNCSHWITASPFVSFRLLLKP